MYNANLTNEGGVGGKFRFLKNIMGLWLVQQCRETWQAQGRPYSFDELVEMAASADPFRSFIDPDDITFFPPATCPPVCANTAPASANRRRTPTRR
ncbi:MAG: hypothetical protein HND48_18710 [Chloroflexi bacterium]|nr:hypothetical protein [Chloroflexota bacterium]